MRARLYSAELGRFVSPDILIPDPADPQSYNRYAYVRNNPIRLVDPTGHAEEPFWKRAWDWAVEQYGRVNNRVREWWLYHNPCSMSIDPLCRGFAASPPQPGIPLQVYFVQPDQLERVRDIGRWIDHAESMSDAARAYQRFVNGRSDDLVFDLEGTTFDGFDEAQGLLLDAKSIPERFVDPTTGAFGSWVRGTSEWHNQAQRQTQAAGGVKIVWYFDNETVRDAMYRMFLIEDPELLEHIDLVYKPMD